MKLEQRAKKLKATIPTQGSNLVKVLEELHHGYHLTVQSCLRSCGTTELRKHVARLNYYGWNIKSKWVNTCDGRHKEYWL